MVVLYGIAMIFGWSIGIGAQAVSRKTPIYFIEIIIKSVYNAFSSDVLLVLKSAAILYSLAPTAASPML